jgi:hypothetical protein
MNIEERVQENCEHIARHDEQIKTLFLQQADIKGLADSTHSLALSVEKLTQKVVALEEDFAVISDEKRQKGFAVWQIIVSALIGGVATYIFTHVLY